MPNSICFKVNTCADPENVHRIRVARSVLRIIILSGAGGGVTFFWWLHYVHKGVLNSTLSFMHNSFKWTFELTECTPENKGRFSFSDTFFTTYYYNYPFYLCLKNCTIFFFMFSRHLLFEHDFLCTILVLLI